MRRLSTASFKLSVAPKSGADATVYWLVPSVTQIKRKADGTHLPEYVSCESKSKTGEDSPVSGVGTIKFVFTYKQGSTSAEFIYASRIIVTADMAGISFRLYVGGQKVDEKTVLVVDDGEKGEDGKPGGRGRMPFPAGIWDANATYIATDNIAPIVYHEQGRTYYVMNKTTSVIGLNPGDDYAQNGNNATWIPFENYKAIFTDILMANFAKLSSAVFFGDYMFSQYGKDARGNDAVDYRGFDPDKLDQENSPFTPNLMLDFLKGNAAIGGRKIMFNSDGSGHLANENIRWKSDGNVTIKANISYPSYRFNCDDISHPMKTIDLTKSYNVTLGVGEIYNYTAVCMMPNPTDFPDIEVTIYAPNILTRSSPAYFIRNYNGENFMYNRFSHSSTFKFNEIDCTGVIAKFKSMKSSYDDTPSYSWFLINLNELGKDHCTIDKWTKK